jgi:hypothetical protein
MCKLAACFNVYSIGHFTSGYSPAWKHFDDSIIKTDVADMAVKCSNSRMWSLNKRQMEDAEVHVKQWRSILSITYFKKSRSQLPFNCIWISIVTYFKVCDLFIYRCLICEVGDHFIYFFYICCLFNNAVSSSASNFIFIVQNINHNNILAVVYIFQICNISCLQETIIRYQ